MLKIDGTIKQILGTIDELYDKDVYDYKGNVINKNHVVHYLLTNYYRILEIVKLVSLTMRPGTKILDIGIGYGFYDIILEGNFRFDVTGMEIKENIPAYCPLPQSHGISIIPGQLCKTPCAIPDNSFDMVILSSVIEHLRTSPLRALKEIKRILKPAGRVLLTTPNISRLANILRLIKGENIVEMFADDDTDLVHITDPMAHIREYTMSELKALMNRAGYKIMHAKYSLSNNKIPPCKSMNWEQRTKQYLLSPLLIFFPRLRGLILVLAQSCDH